MEKTELSQEQAFAFLEESLIERQAKKVTFWWVQGEREIMFQGKTKFNNANTLNALGPDSTFIVINEQF